MAYKIFLFGVHKYKNNSAISLACLFIMKVQTKILNFVACLTKTSRKNIFHTAWQRFSATKYKIFTMKSTAQRVKSKILNFVFVFYVNRQASKIACLTKTSH